MAATPGRIQFIRALEDAFACFSQVEGRQKDPLILGTGKNCNSEDTFSLELCSSQKNARGGNKLFPHQPLFCVCQTLLAFFKKNKKQTHISKEAEMKLPYLTVIMTHSKEAQDKALLFYTVPLQY